MGETGAEYVWKGAIPIMFTLHESEITSLPPPPSILVLAPRMGYLPLLAPHIKPSFSSTLPPGDDTVWFEYNGLPLKWYIPTGVLFDLLCPELEANRPWNLIVHFRGYPNMLTPCDGEDTVKWSFINSLKEAAYIIGGNCKNIMNMSQSDQSELWHAVLNGNLEAFLKVTSKLKLGAIEDDLTGKIYPSFKPQSCAGNTDNPGLFKTGRLPVRLYVRIFKEAFDDLKDAPEIDSWEKISYINRPVELDNDKGQDLSLGDAMKKLLPEFFDEIPVNNEKTTGEEVEEEHSGDAISTIAEDNTVAVSELTKQPSKTFEIKLIRIQGTTPTLKTPFSWVVNNLMNPDHYVHICVYLIHLQSASL